MTDIISAESLIQQRIESAGTVGPAASSSREGQEMSCPSLSLRDKKAEFIRSFPGRPAAKPPTARALSTVALLRAKSK
jgi:hypothetical protein